MAYPTKTISRFTSALLMTLTLALSSCGPRRSKAGYPTPIPDCVGGYAWVGKGCYVQEFPDRIEVRCPGITTKYSRCVREH